MLAEQARDFSNRQKFISFFFWGNFLRNWPVDRLGWTVVDPCTVAPT
jgi:hypothetical protein